MAVGAPLPLARRMCFHLPIFYTPAWDRRTKMQNTAWAAVARRKHVLHQKQSRRARTKDAVKPRHRSQASRHLWLWKGGRGGNPSSGSGFIPDRIINCSIYGYNYIMIICSCIPVIRWGVCKDDRCNVSRKRCSLLVRQQG